MIRLFFGLGLGYLLGTLFAPRKGSITREEIGKKLDDLREELTQRSLDAKDELSDGLSKAADSLAQAKETAAGAVNKLDKDIHEVAKKVQE
jgi:gas vesicle protein